MRYLVLIETGFFKLLFRRPNKKDFAKGATLFRIDEEATVSMLYDWLRYDCPDVKWLIRDEGW